MTTYIRIHPHQWAWTDQRIHDQPVSQCTICGDLAYDVPEEAHL